MNSTASPTSPQSDDQPERGSVVSSRLFWKIWLTLFCTFALVSGSLYVGMQSYKRVDRYLNDRDDARHRPWRVTDMLANQAEQAAADGMDLRQWRIDVEGDRFGQIYLLDAQGIEIANRALPDNIRHGTLRLFQPLPEPTLDTAATESTQRPVRGLRGFARAVFVPEQAEPLTLVYLPNVDSSLIERMMPAAAVWLAVPIVVTGGLAWLLAGSLIRPLRRMRDASLRVAVGDFGARVGPPGGRGRDELADLGRCFDEMAVRLAAQSTVQTTLFRDISHELRSPLARLRVACELLGHESSLARDDLVDRIDKEFIELDELIADILCLAKLEQNAMVKSWVSVGDLITEIVEDAAFEGARHDVEVHCLIGCRLPAIWGNAKDLRKAIENVVRNALAFSPKDAAIEIHGTSVADNIEIAIRDRGPGLVSDELPLIFNPFYRSDASRGRNSGGTGVGLAITQRIVAQHQGTIAATNRREGGLDVTICLPCGAAEGTLTYPSTLPQEAITHDA